MRALRVLLVSIALLLLAAPARAQTAEELVPFEKLDVPLRDELWKVCQRYSVRRKMPDRGVACTVDTYEWLLRHLPLASEAARKLDLGRYLIKEGAADTAVVSSATDAPVRRFSIDDTEGAFANCEVVFEEKGRIVVVARGTVEGLLLPKTAGTGVIVVRYRQDPASEKRVITDCHVFFRVASDVLHRVTAPFQRTLGKILGAKLEGLIGCATTVSEESERDPERVWKAVLDSETLDKAQAAEFRKKFLLH